MGMYGGRAGRVASSTFVFLNMCVNVALVPLVSGFLSESSFGIALSWFLKLRFLVSGPFEAGFGLRFEAGFGLSEAGFGIALNQFRNRRPVSESTLFRGGAH